MTTLSQVLNILAKERGVHREFRMNGKGEMRLQDSDKIYKPEELTILRTYRFEANTSSPEDNAVLYVIGDELGNKGIIIDAYGADSDYSGPDFDAFLRDIPVNEQDEYKIGE